MNKSSLFCVLAFACASWQVVGNNNNDARPIELHMLEAAIVKCGEQAREEFAALTVFLQNLSQKQVIEMFQKDQDLTARIHQQWGQN